MKKTLSALLLFTFTAAPLFAEAEDSSLKLSMILEASNRFYATVKNYHATFYKQEVAKGKLQETEKIFLKFEKPFKIFMGWLNTEKKDLQVVYERGKHKGKLAIHKPGLALGLLPVIFLDQDSPYVREGSEAYDIEDAGIGTFLEDFTKVVAKARAAGQLRVKFLPGENGAETAEVTFEDPDRSPEYFAHRIVVTFDPGTKLPVKMKFFDWDDRLTGDYAYENLQVNLGAEDAEFKRQINRQLYRVYQGGGR